MLLEQLSNHLCSKDYGKNLSIQSNCNLQWKSRFIFINFCLHINTFRILDYSRIVSFAGVFFRHAFFLHSTSTHRSLLQINCWNYQSILQVLGTNSKTLVEQCDSPRRRDVLHRERLKLSPLAMGGVTEIVQASAMRHLLLELTFKRLRSRVRSPL